MRGNGWLPALAKARGLQHLQLVNVLIDDGGARILAGGGFKGLVRLSLRNGRFGDAGLLALVRSPHLPRPRSRRLARTSAREWPSLSSGQMSRLLHESLN